MNMFFRLTALAGLLAIAGQTFAVEDITRADQIPVLKEETQHATVSERVTSRFTRSHYRQFDLDQAFSAKIFDRYLDVYKRQKYPRAVSFKRYRTKGSCQWED